MSTEQVNDNSPPRRPSDDADRASFATPTPSRPPKSRLLARIALVVFSLAVSSILVDLAVRLLDLGPPVYEPRRFEPDGRVPYARLPSGVLTYQPNARFASVYDDRLIPGHPEYTTGRVEYVINEYGFRGPSTTVEKKPGVTRIACLGDSFTFGEGVREADTVPQQLEGLLNQSGNATFEVLNCGVQGHGAIDEFLYYKTHVSQFRPDIVILSFFLNDAMDGADTLRQNDEWSRSIDLSPFARVSKIREIFERRDRARALQDAYFASIRNSFATPRWELCQRALRDLHQSTRQTGARLVVMIWPVLFELNERYPFKDLHQNISAVCESQSIPCIDLLSPLSGEDAARYWVHPTDHHPNGKAAHHVAKALASLIRPPVQSKQ